MKLNEIASVRNGITSKLSEGNDVYDVVDLSYKSTKEYKVVKTTLSETQLRNYSIKSNMLLISGVNGELVALGREHENKLVGKNIYIVEVNTEKFDVLTLGQLFKFGLVNIFTSGKAIQRLNRQDLLNVDIPKVDQDELVMLEKFEKYSMLLEKQKIKVDELINGIATKIKNKERS